MKWQSELCDLFFNNLNLQVMVSTVALQWGDNRTRVYPFRSEVTIDAGLAVYATGVARTIHTHATADVFPVDVQTLVSICNVLIIVTLLSLPMAVAG